jgi:hypothetical protein
MSQAGKRNDMYLPVAALRRAAGQVLHSTAQQMWLSFAAVIAERHARLALGKELKNVLR